MNSNLNGVSTALRVPGLALLTILLTAHLSAQTTTGPRHDSLLDSDWRTACDVSDPSKYAGFEQTGFDDKNWQTVQVPHNWDEYDGLRLLTHGNLHGTAWYRREFVVNDTERGRGVFLFFEGVGSYAKVWVNGKFAGKHDGGRTTFTLDVTGLVNIGTTNLLAVEADHPDGIRDLPWVEGGSSTERGFSEGSQPMGIFRPVHLITTGLVRVEPFGVHVWNDAMATQDAATVHLETEVHNYSPLADTVTVETKFRDCRRKVVADLRAETVIASGQTITVKQDTPSLSKIHLWSLENPYLYTLETTVSHRAWMLDRVETPFGIRVIRWPSSPGQFLLNGQPIFINGTCEYENVLGSSHAFGEEQIRAVVRQVEAAGFNAFRDAHQPHNLRFQTYWDHDGVLWWPQFVSHIWFDTPAFRENFKTLLREWVRERRNSPSLILWGLSNESSLPEPFAKECTEIIREMDPTSPSQRLVVTCNGGKGTDWNVPQNWSGTYGGDVSKYADELRNSRLTGEYGAWRSSEIHSEGGFIQNGVFSEDRYAALLETKVRLAESVRDRVCGQFQWLLGTHENPGRALRNPLSNTNQTGTESWGDLKDIGPVNNKGLLTLWGQPTDAYYMYRGNYAPAKTDPMVMIVSHTWPDRWTGPGLKTNIIVYSNCKEVELFNDFKSESLGRRARDGRGTHFQWDNVNIQHNVLYAEGRMNGKVVAGDVVVLHNLPDAPHRAAINGKDARLTAPVAGMNYLYRVNCGGSNYDDTYGNRWLADHNFSSGDTWGSVSWAAEYAGLNPRLGSQAEISDPIIGTHDEALFQSFRFGREKLRYYFAVPDGEYTIDLFFTEPWYGRGGGNCKGWRLFDVAVNGDTVIHDLDIWRECGYSHALKKTVHARVTDGWLEISFPCVASYEAVISAIAISTPDMLARIPQLPPLPARLLTMSRPTSAPNPSPTEADASGQIYPASHAQLGDVRMDGEDAVFEKPHGSISWTVQAGLGGEHDLLIHYNNPGTMPLTVEIKAVTPNDGTIIDAKQWELAPTGDQAWANSGPENGLSFNAGKYIITLSVDEPASLRVRSLFIK